MSLMWKSLALAAVCAPVLSACNVDMKTDVYVSDFKEVLDGKEAELMAPARITIGFPGTMQQCREKADGLVSYVQGMFPDAALAGCIETDGMENELRVDVRMPIVRIDGEPAEVDARPLSSGAAVVVREGGEMWLKVDADGLNRTVDAMKSENPMVSLETFKASVTVMNDAREKVGVKVSQVFADGEPVWDSTFTLQRRDDLDIVLSDVASDLVRRGFSYPFAQVE